MEIATRLRIEIDPTEPARFRGVARQQAKGFYGKDVTFELGQGKTSYRWIVPKVAFMYDPPGSADDDRILSRSVTSASFDSLTLHSTTSAAV